MPYPGEVLSGVYQIVREIGAGGAGVIYLAYHQNLQKYVVVKKIKDHFVGVLNSRGEVDILKSLHHSYLPQVYDFLQLGDEIFTVMEYIEGRDLKYYIDNAYHFDESSLRIWLEQLCEVLDYLHRHGILHLDIKPANIMLTNEGNICLIDFNISLAGDQDYMTGISELYASPEQYRKWLSLIYQTADKEAALDAATDIYSLGASFHHMMTGCCPSPKQECLIPIEHYQLPYSREFIGIISKMMHPLRRKRLSGADKVLRELKQMKRTKEEKRTLSIVFGGMTAGIVLVLLVLLIVVYRTYIHVGEKEKQEIWNQEIYLEQLCEEEEYELAYQEGVSFYNLKSGILTKVEGAEVKILERIVDACMGMEAYEEAKIYLEQLLEHEQKAEYYKQTAITAAYLGNYDAADVYLEQASVLGANREMIDETYAEIYLSQGKDEEAMAVYKKLYRQNPKHQYLRRVAFISLKLAREETEYAKTAVDCYEQLMEQSSASYADKRNLVTAYIECGMKQQAIALLETMTVSYPQEYEVFLKLGILKYNAESKKAVASQDYSKVKKLIKTAEKLFYEQKTGEQDEQLEQMLQIIAELPET